MQLKGSHAVIGMIHVAALPGTPRAALSVKEVVTAAVAEARLYKECGVDAIGVENMHDVPYLRGAVGPEITAAMAVVAWEVKRACGLPCGLQILAGANREALGAAVAADLDFVRVEGFVFAHVADEGLIQGCAGDLLRYRRHLGAEPIQVLTDIKKKHSAHAITADVDIAETARAAEFFHSDGVIVSGLATGAAADLAELRAVRAAVSIPVVIGSGLTLQNLDAYWDSADSFIVGSHFKQDGCWDRPVDGARVRAFMKRVRQLRLDSQLKTTDNRG